MRKLPVITLLLGLSVVLGATKASAAPALPAGDVPIVVVDMDVAPGTADKDGDRDLRTTPTTQGPDHVHE